MTQQEAIEQLEEMRHRFLIAGIRKDALDLAIAALKREAEQENHISGVGNMVQPEAAPEQLTTKTAAEWFKTVEHEGVRKMLLENWNKHTTGKVGYYEDVWTALFVSFDWRSTDQGYAIWESCHSSQSWQPAIDWWEKHYDKTEPMPRTTPTTPPDNNLRLQIAAQFSAVHLAGEVATYEDVIKAVPLAFKLADELIKASQL